MEAQELPSVKSIKAAGATGAAERPGKAARQAAEVTPEVSKAVEAEAGAAEPQAQSTAERATSADTPITSRVNAGS